MSETSERHTRKAIFIHKHCKKLCAVLKLCDALNALGDNDEETTTVVVVVVLVEREGGRVRILFLKQKKKKQGDSYI